MKKIIKIIVDELNEDLINITLGGSRGKGISIDGWSDYDIYIVVEKFNLEKINRLHKKLKTSIDIHVGITIYTKKEIDNKIVDDKTKVMIYEHNMYKKNLVLFGKDIWFNVTLEEIKLADKVVMSQTIHTLKREMFFDSFDRKKVLKKMTLLIKCLLRKNNIYVFGYRDAFEKFSILCLEKDIAIDDIEKFDVIDYINQSDFSINKQFDSMEKYLNLILNNIDIF